MSHMIVHYKKENIRAVCSMQGIRVIVTDDIESVTCKKCLDTINRKPREFSYSNREARACVGKRGN
jgi:hypothetical protein